MRAILIDDEVDIRELTRLMIECEGKAEIIGEAGDVVTALDLIEDLHPDVAVVDIHLPGIDGVDLIKLLRAKSDGDPRLVAYSCDSAALTRAVDAGADAAVLKTGDSSDLLAALAS